MYTQTAKFEFNDALSQSERFNFLASMAAALEKSILPDRHSSNPGFSLELNRSGGVCVTIWHPRKEDAMWSQLKFGHQSGTIKVTQPNNFATNFLGSSEE